jgi:hypothetical protein
MKEHRNELALLNCTVISNFSILKLTVDRKILSLSEADELLSMMISAGYRSPTKNLGKVK